MTKRIISVLLVLVLLAAALPMSAFAAEVGTVTNIKFTLGSNTVPNKVTWDAVPGAYEYKVCLQYFWDKIGKWAGSSGRTTSTEKTFDWSYILGYGEDANLTDSWRVEVEAYSKTGTMVAYGCSEVFHTNIPSLTKAEVTFDPDGVARVTKLSEGANGYSYSLYLEGQPNSPRVINKSMREYSDDYTFCDFSEYMAMGSRYYVEVEPYTLERNKRLVNGTKSNTVKADGGVCLNLKECSPSKDTTVALGEKKTVSFTLKDLPFEATSIDAYAKCWMLYSEPEQSITESPKVKGTSASRDITFSKPGLYTVDYVAQLFDKSGNALCKPKLLKQVKFNVGYGVWVNGVEFTPDKTKITCGSGYAELRTNKAPYTIALSKATIDTPYVKDGSAYGIYSPYGGITLSMGGKNSITITDTDGSAYGIYVKGAVKIDASGDLDITTHGGILSYGIFATEGMTDKHAGSLNISALNSDSSYNATAVSSPNGTSNTLSGACRTFLLGGTCAGYHLVLPSGKTVRVSDEQNTRCTAAWDGTTALSTYKYAAINDGLTHYDVYVGGREVTSANKSDVFEDGTGNVSYDPSTNTLTIGSADVTPAPLSRLFTGLRAGKTACYAVFAKNNLTVDFSGNAKINDASVDNAGFGICSLGALTLKGTNLDIQIPNTSYAVGSNAGVTLDFTGEVKIAGALCGINCVDNIKIKNGTVTLAGYNEYSAANSSIDLSSYPAARQVVYRVRDAAGTKIWTGGNTVTGCSDYALIEISPATYGVTLDTTKLVGADVTGVPSKAEAGGFTITIAPRTDRAFITKPTVTVTGATAGAVTTTNNFVYTCVVTNVTGPVKVTVTGNADGWYQYVSSTASFGQVKLSYDGNSSGWGTYISVYKPNGTKMVFTQKAEDGFYFDGWRSPTDSAKVFSRDPEYSYTVNGSATRIQATFGILNDVKRIYGASRTATAAAISAETYATADSVVLASGDNYADALAGVTFAVAKKAPILLVQKAAGLDKATLDEIARLKAKNVYILGGTAAIPETVETQLKNSGCTVTRVKGKSRYETAVEIADSIETILGGERSELYFVCAENYPDALAVSGIAASRQGAILYMSKQGTLDAATEAYLKSRAYKAEIYIIGGTGAVGAPAEAALAKYDSNGSVQRVKGQDRYLTCIEINKTFGGFKGDKVCVATGLSFPDALAGGVLCAEKQMPLILVPKDIRSDTEIRDQYRYFVSNYMNLDLTVYVLGGKAAVSEKIADRFSKTSFYDLRS